jgi:hypothetical protein
MATLQRQYWYVNPIKVFGEGWRFTKVVGGRTRHVVCDPWIRQLGWELRLATDGGELQRWHVVRSQDEILDATEQWKPAMVGKAWDELPSSE